MRSRPKSRKSREDADFESIVSRITPEQRLLMRKCATPWRDANARSRGDPLPAACLAPPAHRSERRAEPGGRTIERRW